MPSPETSRVNLGGAWNPWTDRSREESALVWRLTLQWWLGGRNGGRNPRTQRAWAKQLSVSQPYVAKMERRFKRNWLSLADKWRNEPEATLDDLRRAAESRKVASELRPHPEQMRQQPQHSPAWASYSTVLPTQIDAEILAYIGYNPNRSKGSF